MCTCPTKSGPRGANAVGEEHLQMWHVLNVHQCVSLGKEFRTKVDIESCILFPTHREEFK